MNQTPNEKAYRPISVRLTDPIPSDDHGKLADPRRDHLQFTKPKGKTDRLMRLLDSLECENPNRRCKH